MHSANTTNPSADPTKWRDRMIEFSRGAKDTVGSAAGVGGGVVSSGLVAAGADVATIAVAGGSVGLATGAATLAVSAIASNGEPARPRPVARTLGMVFPILTAFTAGMLVVYKMVSAPTPPAPQVEARPETALIVKDSSNQQAHRAVDQIKAAGLPPMGQKAPAL